MIDKEWLASRDDMFSETTHRPGLDVVADAFLNDIARVQKIGRKIVRQDIHHLRFKENLVNLVADDILDGLHFHLGG